MKVGKGRKEKAKKYKKGTGEKVERKGDKQMKTEERKR